jgi:hypothetical protein
MVALAAQRMGVQLRRKGRGEHKVTLSGSTPTAKPSSPASACDAGFCRARPRCRRMTAPGTTTRAAVTRATPWPERAGTPAAEARADAAAPSAVEPSGTVTRELRSRRRSEGPPMKRTANGEAATGSRGARQNGVAVQPPTQRNE